MNEYKVLKISKNELKKSINGLSQIKHALQKECLKANIDGQGEQDAKELGGHFDTAINAMITILAFMESNTADGRVKN